MSPEITIYPYWIGIGIKFIILKIIGHISICGVDTISAVIVDCTANIECFKRLKDSLCRRFTLSYWRVFLEDYTTLSVSIKFKRVALPNPQISADFLLFSTYWKMAQNCPKMD